MICGWCKTAITRFGSSIGSPSPINCLEDVCWVIRLEWKGKMIWSGPRIVRILRFIGLERLRYWTRVLMVFSLSKLFSLNLSTQTWSLYRTLGQINHKWDQWWCNYPMILWFTIISIDSDVTNYLNQTSWIKG